MKVLDPSLGHFFRHFEQRERLLASWPVLENYWDTDCDSFQGGSVSALESFGLLPS